MSKPKIYWAAPLHDESDQKRNIKYVNRLRAAGFPVYLPQEHGVWEEFPNPEEIRPHLYKMDLKAMSEADICIACFGDKEHPREPSEGGMFEMGWMKGANKTVYLYNEDNYWRFNLMPEFGCDEMFSDFEKLLLRLETELFE